MDFSVLSRYDDMLATYFVDSLYLWYDTLRMNSDFVGTTVNKKDVVNRIREHVVGEGLTNKAIKDAAESFLKLPYFQEYIKDLPVKQVNEFTQHMKRYLSMYRPNAGFEVGSTTRYTGKPEACILATKVWKAGEQVTCCVGSIAALSVQDDLKLKKEGRDFSVMVSTRKKCACLFLGPARFMNHDCDSNCEFILLSQNAITFRVIKDIPKGEEMTVFYADHYFGENNCECLCASCERLQQGHFSIQSSEENTVATNSDSEIATPPDENMSNNRRSRRKRKEISYKDYYVLDQAKKSKVNVNLEINGGDSHPTALVEITNSNVNINVIEKSPIMQQEITSFDNSHTIQSIEIQSQLPSPPPPYLPTDSWIYMPANANPDNYVKRQEQYNLIYGAQMKELKDRRQSMPQEGEHILLADPPLLPHAFTPLPNQQIMEGSFQTRPTIDPDVQLMYDWLDNLSDLSDTEDYEIRQFDSSKLRCCPKAKEYCMSRRSENPDLCGRCNRHYQIYGLSWPLRQINKPLRRVKNKESGKASTAQPTSPVIASPSITQGQRRRQSRSKSTSDRKRNRSAQKSSISSTFTVDNPAVSYQNDPIVIHTRLPNLSVSNIYNNSVPIYQIEYEKALAMNLRNQLDKNKATSLDRDIEVVDHRFKQLRMEQLYLLEEKSRLRQKLFSQNQQNQQNQQREDMHCTTHGVIETMETTHEASDSSQQNAQGIISDEVQIINAQQNIDITYEVYDKQNLDDENVNDDVQKSTAESIKIVEETDDVQVAAEDEIVLGHTESATSDNMFITEGVGEVQEEENEAVSESTQIVTSESIEIAEKTYKLQESAEYKIFLDNTQIITTENLENTEKNHGVQESPESKDETALDTAQHVENINEISNSQSTETLISHDVENMEIKKEPCDDQELDNTTCQDAQTLIKQSSTNQNDTLDSQLHLRSKDTINYTRETNVKQSITGATFSQQQPAQVSSIQKLGATSPVVYIELADKIDTTPKKKSSSTPPSTKARPTTPTQRSQNSSTNKKPTSRKGCPIAPPSKEPYSNPTPPIVNSSKRTEFGDPPAPRVLPPLAVTASNSKKGTKRYATASNTGPFIPNEYT